MTPKSNKSNSHLLPLLSITIFFLIFYRYIFLGEKSIPYDCINFFYPIWKFNASTYKSGHIPLWNPYFLCGYPIFSSPQGGVFSPLIMLLLAIPDTISKQWFDIVEIVHLYFGSIFLYLTCIRFKLFRIPALTAALLFLGGGASFARLQHSAIIFEYSYFSITFYFLATLLRQPRLIYSVSFGIFGGLMLTLLNQVTYLGLFFILLYVIYYSLAEHKGGWRPFYSRFKMLFLSTGIALMIGSPQIYSTLLILPHSIRQNFNYEYVAQLGLSPVYILTALIPNFFGSLSGSCWGPFDITESYLYASLLPFTLFIALGFKRDLHFSRFFWFLCCAGLFFFLYSLGGNTPLFKYIFTFLPGVSLFKRPSDATFLLSFISCLLTALIFNKYLQEDISPPSNEHSTHQPWPLATTKYNQDPSIVPRFSLWLFSAIFKNFQSFAYKISILLCLTYILIQINSGLSVAIEKNISLSLFSSTKGALAQLAFFSLFAFFLLKISPRRKSPIAILMLLFCGYDIMNTNGLRAEFSLSRDLAENERALNENNAYQETWGFIKQYLNNSGQSYDRIDINYMNNYAWDVNHSMLKGVQNTNGYIALQIQRYFNLTGREWKQKSLISYFDSPLFNLLSSPLIVFNDHGLNYLDKKLNINIPKQFTLLHSSGSYRVYKNENALPRAFMSYSPIVCSNTQECEQIITDSNFDPSIYSIIEPITNGAPSGKEIMVRWENEIYHNDSKNISAHQSQYVQITSYNDNEIKVDVRTNMDGYLIVLDSYFPGWVATADGEQVPVHRADYMFRGVFLTSGKHSVVFNFKPFSYKVARNLLPNFFVKNFVRQH